MSIESISLKFRSGNSVPVNEARVTSAEWRNVNAEIERLRAENERMKAAINLACAPDMWIETAHGTYEYKYVDWYVDLLQEALEPCCGAE
jgi:hypothetical protein